jgi:alpha-methylacyl-CoA racemase
MTSPRGISYRPLAGVRVLDMSRLIVGSLATRQLADLGAEVVKIEDPITGDYLRSIPPLVEGEGVWNWLLNRNKKSVALDVTEEAGRDTLIRLIEVSDVFVEVSRPGSLLKLGVDIAALRRRHRRLVACSISGFGQTGEWATLPAHGMNMDGLAGTAATNVVDGEENFVQLAYTSLGNEQGATNAALAILGALVGARETGEGAWIDISCWDGLVDLNRAAIAYQAATGDRVQDGGSHMWGAMHRLYHTKDDRLLFFAAIEWKFWQRFCVGIERPDLLDRWHSDGQVDYGDFDLRQELEPLFASRTGDEWARSFLEWSVPGSLVLDLTDVMASPHFAARQMLEHDEIHRIPNVASPIRFIDQGGGRPGSNPSPPPKVGADTDEVLARWLSPTA